MYHQRNKFLRGPICYRISVIDVCARTCIVCILNDTTMKRISNARYAKFAKILLMHFGIKNSLPMQRSRGRMINPRQNCFLPRLGFSLYRICQKHDLKLFIAICLSNFHRGVREKLVENTARLLFNRTSSFSNYTTLVQSVSCISRIQLNRIIELLFAPSRPLSIAILLSFCVGIVLKSRTCVDM